MSIDDCDIDGDYRRTIEKLKQELDKVREDLKEAAKFMLSDARRTLNMCGISDLEKADAEKQAALARNFMKEKP